MIMFTVVYLMWLCGSGVGGIPLTDRGLGCSCYGSSSGAVCCGKITWNKGSRLKKSKSDVPFDHKSCTVYTFTHTHSVRSECVYMCSCMLSVVN